MTYQWTYEPRKGSDFSALLVNRNELVIGMVTGDMADALYHILMQPPEMDEAKKLIVASQITKKCQGGHVYPLSEGSCPGCAQYAGIIDQRIRKVIDAAILACHNNNYKLHEDLREALNPFQENPQ